LMVVQISRTWWNLSNSHIFLPLFLYPPDIDKDF
jgi:hypothetical protein